MTIILGSAQFGLNYGITNKKGKVSEQELVKILELAAESGITTIDTAPAYGSSEETLGKYCHSIGKFKFI